MPEPPNAYPHAGARIAVPPWQVQQAPAFAVAPPAILNPQHLSLGTRVLLEKSWKRGSFPARDIEVFRLHDVYVTEECLVLDRDLRVLENVSDEYSDAEVAQAIDDIHRLHAQAQLLFYKGGIVAKRRASGNYGHFMLEMLPMALIGRTVVDDPEWIYLLHRADPDMMDVMLRAFRLIDVPMRRLVIKDFRQPVFFGELVVVRQLTEHGKYMSPLAVQATASLADRITPGADRLLYVRRIPGWQRGRALLNQDEICDRLVRRGFTVIEPGSMTLEAQIAAFAGADVVVGPMGAALSNIVFCRPGTRVLALVPSRFPDLFFWFIALHKRLDYAELRAEQRAMDGPDDWKADFSLSETDIRMLEDLAGTEPAAAALQITAHVQGQGDAGAGPDGWVGTPHSGRWIEGFSITPEAGLAAEEIAVQAVLEANWMTPWCGGGTFCGSQGRNLPLRGLAVRLTGATADRFDCRLEARFTDGATATAGAGACCVSPGLAPLEAFRVSLTRRG
jgi:capsular polysaccharide biosynthesis protein